MAVSREQVLAIAALARLRLTEDETATYAVQLSDILGHVETLADATTDTRGDGPPDVTVRLRPDSPPADPLHESPARFAPAWHDEFFTVPRLAAMDRDDEPTAP